VFSEPQEPVDTDKILVLTKLPSPFTYSKTNFDTTWGCKLKHPKDNDAIVSKKEEKIPVNVLSEENLPKKCWNVVEKNVHQLSEIIKEEAEIQSMPPPPPKIEEKPRHEQKLSFVKRTEEPVQKPRLLLNKKIESQEDTGYKKAKRLDLLCSLPNNHDINCKLCHNIELWTPKICKFKNNCNRIHQCPFWHSETETKINFILRSFTIKDSYFIKHKDKFINNYKLKKN
jgi:hypothetical protein